MTLKVDEPEEARGEQFETATPVQVEEEEEEEEETEDQSVTPFDYSTIEIHTETPTEGTSDIFTYAPDTYPDVVTGSGLNTDMVPDVLTDTDLEGVKTQEPGDQTATRTTTMTPYMLPVSSPASIIHPSSGPVPHSVSQPVTDGSASRGTDGEVDAMQEGSAEEALPTPAADSGVMTDETEIGGTEFPTFIPDTQSQGTITQTQTEDLEGSASGEDEASGQDIYPPETPRFTSTLPPIHSTLHTQQPQPAAGAEVTEMPVVSPAVDTVSETGSGAEQLSGEGEVSEDHGGLPREVTATVLPDVAAVTFGDQTTLTTDIKSITSEPSTPKYSTHTSPPATDDMKHPAVTTKPAPATPDDHTSHPTEFYRDQTEQSTTSSTQYVSQPLLSSTSPLYTFDHNTHSVPQWALSPDPAATVLPEDYDDDKEIIPHLLESRPGETQATEKPESGTDSSYSVEASTVNVGGT